MARRARHLSALAMLAAAAIAVAVLGVPAVASAEAPPHWRIESRTMPTNLPLEGKALLEVVITNLGGVADGEAKEIQITDTLPAGVELNPEVEAAGRVVANSEGPRRLQTLKFNPTNKQLINPKGFACSLPEPGKPVTCTLGQKLRPYEQLEIYMEVKTHFAAAAEPLNEVKVTGGEAPEASLSRPLKVNGQPQTWGVEHYELQAEAEDGQLDTQAGSHPFQLTTSFYLNEGPATHPALALQRNLSFQLPPGLIGDANVVGDAHAVKQCPGVDFGAVYEEGQNGCPPDTVIGEATLTYQEPAVRGHGNEPVPVFNLVPAPGEPARFGFEADHVPVVLDTSVRTGGDYAAVVSVHNASQAVEVLGARVTIWGAPTASSHDQARGWACLGYRGTEGCLTTNDHSPTAFLTLPTSCSGVLTTSVNGESWPFEEGGKTKVSKIGTGEGADPENTIFELPSALTGCSALNELFDPTVTVEPEQHEGNTPTGLKMHIRMPQQSALEAEGLAPPAIKSTTVQFPEGVLLNPAAANGLQACLEGETEATEVSRGGVGYTGSRELGEGFEGSVPTFTETLPEPLQPGTNFCANASKVGVVHIKTPDLPNEIVGGVYTAAQTKNPFGSLFAIYIVAQDPVSKVLVKLAGEVKLNSTTGQITTTFANTPDLPFEELTLELFGGPGATLSTPQACGAAGPTKATFTSWAQEPGEAPDTVTREVGGFENTSQAEKSGCPGTQPLAPSFSAGSANPQAGAFSPFELTINHPDADQPMTGLTTVLPPGLAAVIASVTPCKEPDASQGTCGPESLIGKAEASVGLGSEPFTQKEGRVYLTGPYEGAPFGLSVVVPTKAGPFDFGNVVTRSTIQVNEETAAVTISSPLPTFVNTLTYPGGVGVPVQLKSLHVVVDREHFQFNPTNCAPMSITGTITGASGGSAGISSPFQAQGCQNLTFAPKFGITVAGQGSKANGTGFTATVESGGIGVEGIRKVFLTVPKILPARLQPTLQNACLDKVFVVNPAGCPEDSFIGTATVQTPVLKTPLSGPAILVSHGNAAFPDVEFVLQSENIHILLDGKTDIKKGVTYSRFESAPDAPFTKFVSEFPAGPHSIFTDNTEETSTSNPYNLCGKTILAPTEITSQDGRVIKQETHLAISGCGPVKPNSKPLTRAQKLAKALKACKKDKKKSKRQACERAARKKYGPKTKQHGKKTSGKKH